jgi:hypothetical protein
MAQSVQRVPQVRAVLMEQSAQRELLVLLERQELMVQLVPQVQQEPMVR